MLIQFKENVLEYSNGEYYRKNDGEPFEVDKRFANEHLLPSGFFEVADGVEEVRKTEPIIDLPQFIENKKEPDVPAVSQIDGHPIGEEPAEGASFVNPEPAVVEDADIEEGRDIVRDGEVVDADIIENGPGAKSKRSKK